MSDDFAVFAPEVRAILEEALAALTQSVNHFSAVDVSNAHMNLAEPRFRPLTMKVGDAARALDGLLHGEAVENAGLLEAPVRHLATVPSDVVVDLTPQEG